MNECLHFWLRSAWSHANACIWKDLEATPQGKLRKHSCEVMAYVDVAMDSRIKAACYEQLSAFTPSRRAIVFGKVPIFPRSNLVQGDPSESLDENGLGRRRTACLELALLTPELSERAEVHSIHECLRDVINSAPCLLIPSILAWLFRMAER